MDFFTFLFWFGAWTVLAIIAFALLTSNKAPVSYFVAALICPPVALFLLIGFKNRAKQKARMDMYLAKLYDETDADGKTMAHGVAKVIGDPAIDSKSTPLKVLERMELAREYASMPECLRKEPLVLKKLFNFKETFFNEEWALEAVRKRVGFDTKVKAITSGKDVVFPPRAEEAPRDAGSPATSMPPRQSAGVNVNAWRIIGRARGLLDLILKDYGLFICDENAGTSALLRQTGRLVKPTDAVQCACLASLHDRMTVLVDQADEETQEACVEQKRGSDEAELLFKRFPSKYGEAAALDFDYYVNNDKHGVSDKEEGLTWKSVVALIIYLIIYLLIEAFFPD